MIIDKINMNKIMVCTIIVVILMITMVNVYGADPTLVNKLNSAFKKIQSYLVKLATPIAGVAIATGAVIRKLSFGDEEKMVIGKKVIINAIICYVIIMSIDLIIKFIDEIIK
ncbi:MAG: hypothetical protein N2749_06385 [Clostridia bacterium]|nr:hypothetical protein [Clostridia bacterium]